MDQAKTKEAVELTNEIVRVYKQYGQVCWQRCIPTIRARIEQLPLPEGHPDNVKLVQSIAVIAAKAFRLGMKCGIAVGQRETKKTGIITLN